MSEEAIRTRKRKKRRRLMPAGLRREEAAEFVGISIALWDRLVAAGKTPAPVRLGTCVIWSRRQLSRWIDAGCPERAAWESQRT